MTPDSIQTETVIAVKGAAQELAGSRLFGFALCTDDDVSTLFHVACTADWVAQESAKYPEVGFVYVEWPLSVSSEPFDRISQKLAALAKSSAGKAWAAARDRRFNALVAALGDCRKDGIFEPGTLLCVGSTDPSDHLKALTIRGVDALNARHVADHFAGALGYAQYR